MKNKITLLTIILFVTLGSGLKMNAQFAPQFDGIVGSYEKILVVNNFNDGTAALQALIDDVTLQATGGTIKLSGNIKLSNIYLKSNVHIDISKGTIIKGDLTLTKAAIFEIGDTPTLVENVKIFCSQSDRSKPNDDLTEKFVFDLTEFGMNGKIRAIMLSNVANFWLSDIYIKDALTQFNGITLNPYIIQTSTDNSVHQGLRDYKIIGSPSKGEIRNVYGKDQHYGYGLIQIQSARNVNFVKLSGNGGVILRMESGSNIQYVGTDNEQELGIIKGIKASDINQTNGFAAVMMSPHGRVNGDVYLENIKSTSSTFAIVMATGFFDAELKDANGNLVDPVKFKKGRFAGPIVIKNVDATFGINAYGRLGQEYSYVEKGIQAQYPWATLTVSPETDKARIMPSAAAIGHLCLPSKGGTPDIVEGEYVAQIDGPVTSSGFKSCINSFYNNTLYENDSKNVDCSTLSLKKNQLNPNVFSLYPNPTTEYVAINWTVQTNRLEVYNASGILVQSVSKLEDVNTFNLNVTGYAKGIYFVKMITNDGIIAKRIIVN
ncbi:T9SS type A sorting domain-containing protein [Flavobacterium algicola]|uniref:T9SS type A sorting domain-containing protein n=1 Tax=Flavobacterium algicola TaxID=556529 RepID=UPI001EFD3696|nr:T9SS type A sorting domain-containing protein [Flavobacterium algicola]MCG9793695.1 T9SS type A sorting domain-containing protein [Flavobacterium algicola]